MRSQYSASFVALLLVAGFSVIGGRTAAGATPGEGALDTTFSSDGRVATTFGSWSDAHALAVQSDGKIVAAGESDNAGAIARYLPNGSLDSTFGVGGKVTVNEAVANAVAIQPDGRIVLAGQSGGNVAVLRYNSDGSLDSSFSGDGIVSTSMGISGAAKAVVVQTDGAIVVTGTVLATGSDGDAFMVARYTAAGELDTTFAQGAGYVLTAIGSEADASATVLQSGGKIVVAGTVAGSVNGSVAVARYTTSGALDSTFSGDGLLLTKFGGHWPDDIGLGIQRDGKLVLAGNDHAKFAVARYTSAGALDTSFSGDGRTTVAIGAQSAARDVIVQRDGKIVVGGSVTATSSATFALARFGVNGALDTSFSGDGKVMTAFGARSWAADVALQRDGKLVVGGLTATTSSPTSATTFAVARYIGDAQSPTGARMVGVPRYSRFPSRTVAWTARDDNTGVRSYTVRYRVATPNADSYGPYITWQSMTSTTSAQFHGVAGRTYAFSVRARDWAGNAGASGSVSYLAFPVDDRQLLASPGWTQLSGAGYYAGTALRSSQTGAELRLRVHYEHLVLLASTGPRNGTVNVYLGNTLLKKVSLASPASRDRVLFTISSVNTLTPGTVRIVAGSGGKPVTIDGLVVSHN